jgi:hypothetical protein
MGRTAGQFGSAFERLLVRGTFNIRHLSRDQASIMWIFSARQYEAEL